MSIFMNLVYFTASSRITGSISSHWCTGQQKIICFSWLKLCFCRIVLFTLNFGLLETKHSLNCISYRYHNILLIWDIPVYLKCIYMSSRKTPSSLSFTCLPFIFIHKYFSFLVKWITCLFCANPNCSCSCTAMILSSSLTAVFFHFCTNICFWNNWRL